MNPRVLFRSAVCLILLSTPAHAQGWIPGPYNGTAALLGPNGSVNAITQWDPDGAGPQPLLTVVGGAFTSIAGMSANRIAAHDPVTGEWQTFGTGLNGTVRALAVYNGQLIVAGQFTDAGGTGLQYLAAWNGTSWQSIGYAGNEVWALSIYNSELVAAGYFTSMNGLPMAHIARWNGSVWQSLGSGLNDWTVCLGQFNGELIAGGWFTDAGGVAANRIARWNGSSWQTLGSGTNAEVLALGVYGGQVWAGGRFTVAGGGAAGHIACWNGAGWNTATIGCDNTVLSFGNFNGYLMVGGVFAKAGGITSPNVARWNGAWADMGGINPDGAVNAFWTYGSDLLMGGSFGDLGGNANANLALWSGTRWAPFIGGKLYSVTALAPFNGRLVAAGNFVQSTPSGTSAWNLVGWNGTALVPFGRGMETGYVNALKSFKYTGAGGSYELIAGGGFTTAGSVAANRIARWNEDPFGGIPLGWQPMGSGFTGGEVYAIERFNNLTYAAGDFTSPATRIARWNETTDTWEPLGSGMNGAVWALQGYNGYLYAGGSFTTAGGVLTGGLARWDGTSWSQCGGNFLGEVRTLTVYNGQLVIGGHYPGINSSPNLAMYNGSTYSTFGVGGTNSYVFGSLASGSRLYITGAFTSAGGVPVQSIAMWDGAWHALPPFSNAPSGHALATWGPELHLGGFNDWLRYNESGLPWFAQQPTSKTVAPGGTATFTAKVAQGYEGLSYQWYRNEVALADGSTGYGGIVGGSGTTTLSISNVTNFDAGPYTCRVTAGADVITSNTATLSMPAPTGVEPATPRASVFEALGPNPANAGATLAFTLTHDAAVTVRVHDVGGRLVRALDPGRLPAGRHQLAWDTRRAGGERAAPGLYFVTLACDGRSLGTRRVTVLR